MRVKLFLVLFVFVLLITGCDNSVEEPADDTKESIFYQTESMQIIYDAYFEANLDNRADIDQVKNLLQLDTWTVVEDFEVTPSATYIRTAEGDVLEFHVQKGTDYDVCEIFKEAEIAPYAGSYRIPKDVLSALEQYMQDADVTAPGITGYVMSRDENSILVVDPLAQDFSSTGGASEQYDAIHFSNAPADVKVGDKVNVWYAWVVHPYPGVSEVKHIEVTASPRPTGAILSESEALERVLTSRFFLTTRSQDDAAFLANKVMAVQLIEFNPEKGSWGVTLRDVLAKEEGRKVYHFRVDDTKTDQIVE
ncbi:MAG: DUF3221 domain-containing protein [Bacillota bacterium]|nr:DUF3221 domain-containing protein [Bacillota bacterium]MDW7682704.1 DUF3221 domain-containing protein [Bacillota bacterium]